MILKHYCSIMPLKVYPSDVPTKERLAYDSLPNVPYSQAKMQTKARAEGRETNNNDGEKATTNGAKVQSKDSGEAG